MTAWILDPDDPSVAFLGSGTDSTFGAAVGPVTLHNVHLPDRCYGRPCVIHNPSDHHMRDWPLHWRDDRGICERICPCPHGPGAHDDGSHCGHGIGHPDPDQLGDGVHGCDGCCSARRA